MDSNTRFGNCNEDVSNIARTLTLLLIGVSEPEGGLYMSQEDYDILNAMFSAERGSYESENQATIDFLMKYLDPGKNICHIFVDRMFCRDCKNAPCEKHDEKNYQMPRSGTFEN